MKIGGKKQEAIGSNSNFGSNGHGVFGRYVYGVGGRRRLRGNQ